MKYAIQIVSTIIAAVSFMSFSYSASADDTVLTMTAQHADQVLPYTKLEVILTFTNESDDGIWVAFYPSVRIKMETIDGELLYHGPAQESHGLYMVHPAMLDSGASHAMKIALTLAHPDGIKLADPECANIMRPIFRDPGEYRLQFMYGTLKSEVSKVRVVDMNQHQDALQALREMQYSYLLLYPEGRSSQEFHDIETGFQTFISEHVDSPWTPDAYRVLGLLYWQQWLNSGRREDKVLGQSLLMFKKAIELAAILNIPRVRDDILGIESYPRINELEMFVEQGLAGRHDGIPGGARLFAVFVLVLLACIGLLYTRDRRSRAAGR